MAADAASGISSSPEKSNLTNKKKDSKTPSWWYQGYDGWFFCKSGAKIDGNKDEAERIANDQDEFKGDTGEWYRDWDRLWELKQEKKHEKKRRNSKASSCTSEKK